MSGGPLADWQLVELGEQGRIRPFERKAVTRLSDQYGTNRKVLSFGPSSYGYDARLAPHFKLFTPYPGAIIDVKKFDSRCYTDIDDDVVVLPAHSYMLGRTVEWFHIPDDVLVFCLGKSSYARAGLAVNVTPLEPGWRGEVTLEIANQTPVPVRIYANEGICQFVFLRGDAPCKLTYDTKNDGQPSKYQDQRGIVTARE